MEGFLQELEDALAEEGTDEEGEGAEARARAAVEGEGGRSPAAGAAAVVAERSSGAGGLAHGSGSGSGSGVACGRSSGLGAGEAEGAGLLFLDVTAGGPLREGRAGGARGDGPEGLVDAGEPTAAVLPQHGPKCSTRGPEGCEPHAPGPTAGSGAAGPAFAAHDRELQAAGSSGRGPMLPTEQLGRAAGKAAGEALEPGSRGVAAAEGAAAGVPAAGGDEEAGPAGPRGAGREAAERWPLSGRAHAGGGRGGGRGRGELAAGVAAGELAPGGRGGGRAARAGRARARGRGEGADARASKLLAAALWIRPCGYGVVAGSPVQLRGQPGWRGRLTGPDALRCPLRPAAPQARGAARLRPAAGPPRVRPRAVLAAAAATTPAAAAMAAATAMARAATAAATGGSAPRQAPRGAAAAPAPPPRHLCSAAARRLAPGPAHGCWPAGWARRTRPRWRRSARGCRRGWSCWARCPRAPGVALGVRGAWGAGAPASGLTATDQPGCQPQRNLLRPSFVTVI